MDTPLRNFRCSDKLWNALRRIAEERGKELSLEPGKLMSSLVRVAIEQYIERHKTAKRSSEPQK
jgi:predicted DNA-binding protein